MTDSPLPEDTGDSPASSSGRSLTPRARLILMLVAAAVLIGGIAWLIRHQTYGKYQQTTNDAYVQADATTVAPKVSGYVDHVFVIENQVVTAGQLLAQIDPRDYRAQAAQTEAQISVAQASAAGVQAQMGEQQAAIAKAQADLAVARNDASFAQSEVARYTPLAASGAETRERLAQLRNQAAQANARVTAAQAALNAAQRRLGTLGAQVQQARAQGEGARAQLAAANNNLGATVIRASTAGRIGDLTVRQGQFVQAGTRLMSVVPTGNLYIEANFKETQMGLMRVGQPVHVEVDALPGVDIVGRVASISPGTGAQFSILPPQNATGNFTKIVQRVPVRIAVAFGPETRALLVPGMSVEVTVDTRSARGAEDRVRREQERHNEQAAR